MTTNKNRPVRPAGLAILLALTTVAVCAHEGFGGTDSPPTRGPSTPTVALLPFHCRAGARYADLATAITLVAGNTIQRSGRAVIVDRAQVEKIFGEKDLAGAGLSDKAELAKKGQTIGADYIVSGYYDAIDQRLVIKAELIPLGDNAFSRIAGQAKLGYKQVAVEGPVSDSIATVEKFAAALRDLLPETKWAATTRQANLEIANNKVIAVFDFVAVPSDKETNSWAGVLTDMIVIDLQGVLPMRMVEREELRAVLREKKLQMAGIASQAEALKAGQLIGADYIVLGSLLKFGLSVRLDIQVIDVASGAIVTTVAQTGDGKNFLAIKQQLALSIAERMGSGLERLSQLRQRKAGKSPEAVIHGWRAHDVAYYGLGKKNDRIKEARRLTQLALDLDSQSPSVLHLAGWVERKFRNYDQAEKYVRQAVELDPNSWWHNNDLARLLRETRSSPQEALPFARRAVELSPDQNSPRLNLALCLIDLRQFKEAEEHARKLVGRARRRSSYFYTLGKALASQGQYLEAAKWYETAARWRADRGANWRGARKAYEMAGEHDKAMTVLDWHLQRAESYWGEQLDLARYLATRNPIRASMFCYKVLEKNRRLFVADVLELLEEVQMPFEEPLQTRAVFDIDKLRGLGVRIYLQRYDDFKYSKYLPYLKTYLEDTLGVPVQLSPDVRPLSALSYDRNTDRVNPCRDRTIAEIKKIRQDTSSTVAMGLISARLSYGTVGAGPMYLPISTLSSGRVEKQSLDRGVAGYDSVCLTFSHLLRTALKLGSTGLMVAKQNPRLCTFGRCGMSRWTNGYLYRSPVPCSDCRNVLQEALKEWPRGTRDRAAIVAGPKEPATKGIKRYVYLVAAGLSAAEAELPAISKAISESLGLGVTIFERQNASKAESTSDLLAWALKEYGILNPVAIVVVTSNRLAQDVKTIAYRDMWGPGITGGPEKLSIPVIAVSIHRRSMPGYLRRSAAVSFPADGGIRTIRAPEYGKLIVGSLAVAAREDHSCWTYGCPATLWYATGVPYRCSYWLCPTCREAAGAYYRRASEARLLVSTSIDAAVANSSAEKSLDVIAAPGDTGAWGYIDVTGEMVIKPQFERAHDFFDGLAGVRLNRRWGYVDRSGNLVIPMRFRAVQGFFEGLAGVRPGRGDWGYINKESQLTIPVELERVRRFSEGLARVRHLMRWGFIDKSGDFAVDPRFEKAGDFHEGLARVRFNQAWGYIDKTGKTVIEPQFDNAWSFTEGLACVRRGNKDGYIDKTGKFVIEPTFDKASWFHEGRARVWVDGLGGYIDKIGQIVVKPRFDNPRDFSEGLARVYFNGKAGFIDRAGTFVIEPQFVDARDFRNGRARVKIGRKWGFIDRTGKLVIPARFEPARDFSGGLARVRVIEDQTH